jgi:hypothetical protein
MIVESHLNYTFIASEFSSANMLRKNDCGTKFLMTVEQVDLGDVREKQFSHDAN